MESFAVKLKQGDITAACRRAGVSSTVYHNSKKIKPENWTAGMVRANIELRKIVKEREAFITEANM